MLIKKKKGPRARVAVAGTCGGYPLCASAASKTTSDGWGWENSASCIVVGSEAHVQKCNGRSSSSSSSSLGRCNGYLLCASASSRTTGDGWGWENSATCIVRNSQAHIQQCNGRDAATSTGGTGRGSGSGSGGSTSAVCPGLQCRPNLSCGCSAIAGLSSRKRDGANVFSHSIFPSVF
jgi:hypothetical protein